MFVSEICMFVRVYLSVLILSTKTTKYNIKYYDELKLISDDKNYDEICAVSSLTRRDRTRMLFEDYLTFKIHPIG